MEAINAFYKKKEEELKEEKNKQLRIFQEAVNRTDYDNLPVKIVVPFHIEGNTTLTREEFDIYLEDIKKIIVWVLKQRYLYENMRRLMPSHQISVVNCIYVANQFTFYLNIEWVKPEMKKYYSHLDLTRFIETIYCYQELTITDSFRNQMIEAMMYGRSHNPRDYPDKQILEKIGWN